MTVKILQGDCLEWLDLLPSNSFDCIVTSPPYWGLRNYGVEGQIGLESTLDIYVEKMSIVGRKLRRVLKPAGTFWLNLGDSYAGGGRGGNPDASPYQKQRTNSGSISVRGVVRQPLYLKPKDLCMIPARVALRLQADGWFLRSEIIWHKPNPMPESVTDRPTCAHEKVWLLTKNQQYFYDAETIKEPMVKGYAGSSFCTGKTAGHQLGRASTKPRRGEKQQQTADNSNPSTQRRMGGFNARWDEAGTNGATSETRNARNVWTIGSQPYKGAHFAVMPTALVEKCVLAGSAEGGHILDPFGGAGTTGLVADRLGRHATLIELNPGYVALAQAWIDKARS